MVAWDLRGTREALPPSCSQPIRVSKAPSPTCILLKQRSVLLLNFMPPPLHVRFCGGVADADPRPQWRILSSSAVKGEGLPRAEAVTVLEGSAAAESVAGMAWTVRGTTSNLRYTTKPELSELVEKQEGLGRPQATHGALILLKKSEAWWSLAQGEIHCINMSRIANLPFPDLHPPQCAFTRRPPCAADERRNLIAKEGHIGHGAFALDYLPAVSRRLHHCRDLGVEEFDFITWRASASHYFCPKRSLCLSCDGHITRKGSAAGSISPP